MVITKGTIDRCQGIRRENFKKMNESERKFKEFLKVHKIKFTAQYPIYSTSSFILVDFVLLKKDIAVEVDRSSHKGRKKSWKQYNAWRERTISQHGLKLYRLTDKDILNETENFRKFKANLIEVF